MLSSKFLPHWKGTESVVLLLLCLAMVCFPFSVAATNVLLGLTLAAGLLSGLWWRGVKQLWLCERVLFVSLTAYLLLIPLGLLWSLDPSWGQRILGRHWFWFLLPVVVMALSSARDRNVFLAAMSLGLTANLLFCVLQANALIDSPSGAGTSVNNATGHIGHTSFGFIYGIWGAWLVHWGLVQRNQWRWLAWGLALWSVIMVFLAQGQSGYLVTICLLLLVAVKWARHAQKKIIVLTAGVVVIAAVVLALGPGHERISGTWQALTQAGQHDRDATRSLAKASAQARLAWWSMSIDIWRQSPFYGVGTGGFPAAAKLWQTNPSWQRGYINDYSWGEIHQPHNQYLITLARYGVFGLLILLILLVVWNRRGLRGAWSDASVSPLIAFTGFALLIHSLDSPGFEEHYSTIFAVILLAAGLSEYHGDRTI